MTVSAGLGRRVENLRSRKLTIASAHGTRYKMAATAEQDEMKYHHRGGFEIIMRRETAHPIPVLANGRNHLISTAEREHTSRSRRLYICTSRKRLHAEETKRK